MQGHVVTECTAPLPPRGTLGRAAALVTIGDHWSYTHISWSQARPADYYSTCSSSTTTSVRRKAGCERRRRAARRQAHHSPPNGRRAPAASYALACPHVCDACCVRHLCWGHPGIGFCDENVTCAELHATKNQARVQLRTVQPEGPWRCHSLLEFLQDWMSPHQILPDIAIAVAGINIRVSVGPRAETTISCVYY